jgi:hypothetical protein
MNACLLMARGPMDDVPLRLFASEKEAMDYASALADVTVAALTMTLCARVYEHETSEVYALWLVRFRDGIPDGGKVVRDVTPEDF